MENPEEKLLEFPLFLNFLSNDKKSLLKKFFELLWEEALPLGFIGKGDFSYLWERHVIESLLPFSIKELKKIFLEAESIADLGSGAGLPAIPLAIALPRSHILSVESGQKKAVFQERVKQKLGLKNLIIHAQNIEKFPPEKKADVVTFRAFRKILIALELSLYALKGKGVVVYYASKKLNFGPREKERVFHLGFSEEEFFPVHQSFCSMDRSFFVFRHVKSPKEGFPRKLKKILKDPLCQNLN